MTYYAPRTLVSLDEVAAGMELFDDIHVDFCGEKGWKSPLHLLVHWSNDEALDIDTRIDCARSAAVYIHSKAPARLDVHEHRPLFESVNTEDLLAALARLEPAMELLEQGENSESR